MSPKIDVEDVEARAREVVREAAGGQMPRVSVLAEAVHEQNGRDGAVSVRSALAHHGERDLASGYDDLLPEREGFAPVDHLLDDSSVQDHLRSARHFRPRRLQPKPVRTPRLRRSVVET